jgi:ABC-2 type transport system ATP-binding protein
MAILMATHDLFNALQVADRIGILREGRLVVEFDAHGVAHEELERLYLQHARGDARDHSLDDARAGSRDDFRGVARDAVRMTGEPSP